MAEQDIGTAALENQLLSVERSRIAAMLRGDSGVLAQLLDDDLAYTHSSGVTDTKQKYLDLVSSGSLVYEEIEIEPKVQIMGEAGVVHAAMKASIRLEGRKVVLRGVYLAVWGRRGDRWTLRALLSTSAPTPSA